MEVWLPVSLNLLELLGGSLQLFFSLFDICVELGTKQLEVMHRVSKGVLFEYWLLNQIVAEEMLKVNSLGLSHWGQRKYITDLENHYIILSARLSCQKSTYRLSFCKLLGKVNAIDEMTLV